MIDTHTHLFNLKYLPVSGILQAHGVPKILANGAAFILLRLTKDDVEVKNLSEVPMWEIFNNRAIEDDLTGERILKMKEKDLIDDIVNKVTLEQYFNEDVTKALEVLESEKGKNESSLNKVSEGLRPLLFGNSSELGVSTNKSMRIVFRKLKRLLKKVFGYIKSGLNYLRWFRFMMRSEHAILKELLGTYGNKIRVFVHHMMDVDNYFVDKSPKFDFVKEQIPKMLSLTKNSGAQLITFVAFDPKRPDGLSIVKQAIKAGCGGVKFYPPMGYRPFGNKDKKLDARNLELFKFCIKNDIPVFTHCTPQGFEAIPGKSGENADPKYWNKLLTQPGMKKLKICFGHAGGTKGWFAPNNTATGKKTWKESHASKVYELCINYPNVYCEVGFLTEVFDKKKRAYFEKRLATLFGDKSTTYLFKNKVMYGSDWHMLFYEGFERNYLSEYEKLFALDALAEYRNLFFEENAVRYLGIDLV